MMVVEKKRKPPSQQEKEKQSCWYAHFKSEQRQYGHTSIKRRKKGEGEQELELENFCTQLSFYGFGTLLNLRVSYS